MKRVLGMCLALMLVLGAVASAGDVTTAMASANYREGKDNMYSWCGYPGPCKIPTAALVLLEKQGPSEVLVGETFTYQIQISNRSAFDLISVVLDDNLPEGMGIESIEPKPDSQSGNKVTWNIGTIPAKSAKVISITGRANMLGCLVSNSLAKICYELPLPLATRVIQCNVELQKTLPEVAELCGPIPMCLTVRNVGSAPATMVRITDNLPEGLVTKDGKSSINIDVGTIPVGGFKSFNVELKALWAGEFTNTACATADRDCYSQSSSTVKVIGTDLELYASAPADGYICTDIPYKISVTNKGEAPAKDVVLTDCIVGDLKPVTISDGGKYARGRITWRLGTMAPGETREVCFVGTSKVEGPVVSDLEVMAVCLEPKRATHNLCLVGVPGVLTSLSDNCDPVQLGGEVVYTVTATNTGSKEATNLVYTIKLDDGMEYVSGMGTTDVKAVNAKTLTFAPVAKLPVGGTVTWKITVKATGTGDKRFTAELKTNELSAPVSKEESTNFYEPNMTFVMAQ